MLIQYSPIHYSGYLLCIVTTVNFFFVESKISKLKKQLLFISRMTGH